MRVLGIHSRRGSEFRILQCKLRGIVLGQDEARADTSGRIVPDLPDVPYERTDFRMVAMAQDPTLAGVAFEVDPFENNALLG